jgi:ribosomal protein S18 acetylase RimI-like enzyme
MSTISAPAIRRDFRDGDLERIVDLHRRVYMPEYDRNEAFIAGVQHSLDVAVAQGWPYDGGGVWLVDDGDRLSGSVALTDEGNGQGRVRWVVFGPELRGRGFGRRLIGEMLDRARADGYRLLELETFSALRAAAHLYRSFGFAVTWERPRDDWGPPIVYQHYELPLS